MSGPPPPPPPPPAPSLLPLPVPGSRSTFGAASPRGPTPQTPMKRLQWVKIPEVKVKNSENLWTNASKMFPSLKVNFGKVEELFSCRTQVSHHHGNLHGNSPYSYNSGNGGLDPSDGYGPATGDPGSQSAFASLRDGTRNPRTDHSRRDSGDGVSSHWEKKRRQEEINLLDPKRSMNVNIFIRQLRLSNLELVEKLRQCDTKSFDVETLKTLARLLPEEADRAALASYRGDPERLGTAEKFYLALMSLPNFDLIIQTLLLKEEFYQSLDTLKPAIDSVIACSKAVKESKAFHEVVYLVLMVGNFLNAGAYSGDAAGFKLCSLLQLGEIKASDGKLHLMHYVAQEAESMDLARQLEELKHLSNDSTHNIPSLYSDIRVLRDGFVSNVLKLSASGDSDEGTLRRLKSMEAAIDSEMTMLATEARDVERLRLELAGYFCEEEGSFKLDDCLGVVNSFCKHFLVAHEENKERKLMAEKAEMKRMERQKSLQRRMSAASGPSPTVFSTGERNGASVEIQNSPCPSNRFVHSTHNQLTQNRARSASCTRGSISEGLQHQQQQQFNGNGASDDCDDSHLLDVLLRPSFAGEKGFEARKFSSLRFNRRRSRNQAELWERERFSSPLGTEDRNSENRSSAPSPCALESPESRKNSALEVGADAKNDSATLALVRNGFARSSCPSRVQVSERQTGGRVCPTSETAGGSSTATAQPDPDEIRPRARNAVDSTTRTKTDLDRRLSREVAMGAASVEQQIRQLESSLSSFDGDLELDKTLGSRSRQNGCSRKNDAALKIPRIRLSSPERLEPKEDPTANGSNINSIKSHNINGNNTNSINNSYSNSKTAETSKTSTAAEESRGGGGANMRERMKRLTQLYCGTEMEVQLGKPSTFGREVSAEDRGVSGPPKELGRSLQRHNQTGTTAAVASDKHLADVNFKDEGFDSEGFSNASASQKSSRSSSRDRDSGQVDWSFGQEGGEEGSAPSQVPSARPDQNSRPDDAASNVSSGNHFDRSIESLVSRESSSLLLSLTAVDCTAINESLRAGPRETARVASEQYQQQVTMRSAGRQTPSRTASSSRQNNARATNGSCSSNGSSRSDGGCSNVRTNNLLSFGCKLSTMVSRTASKPASRVTAFADSKKPADKTGSNIKSNSNNNRRATESRASPNLATVKARSLSRQAQETCRAPRDASSKSGHSTVTNPKFQSQSYGTPRASPRSTSVVGAKTLGHKRPPANSTSSSISSDASAKFAHVSRDTKPRSFQLGSLLSSAASSHQKTSASKRSPFSTPPSVMQVPVRKTRTPSSGSLAPRDVVQARGSNFGRQSSSRSTLPSKLLNSSQRSQTRESPAASSAKKMSDGSILSSRLNRPVKPSMAAGSSAAILNRTTNGRQQGSKGVVQL